MGSSKCGGIVHRLTANYQNLRKYERNNQTSVIHGTLYEITCYDCRFYGVD